MHGYAVLSISVASGRSAVVTHLVDRVFSEVPVRQWVLSLPLALRYRRAYDKGLVSEPAP